MAGPMRIQISRRSLLHGYLRQMNTLSRIGTNDLSLLPDGGPVIE